MPIQGVPKGLTVAQMKEEVSQGAKFVLFQYTISILVVTFKRGTDVYYIRPGESAFAKGLPFTLLTLVAGWWGIPWGPIYSIMCLFSNLSGGKDVTNEVVSQFHD